MNSSVNYEMFEIPPRASVQFDGADGGLAANVLADPNRRTITLVFDIDGGRPGPHQEHHGDMVYYIESQPRQLVKNDTKEKQAGRIVKELQRKLQSVWQRLGIKKPTMEFGQPECDAEKEITVKKFTVKVNAAEDFTTAYNKFRTELKALKSYVDGSEASLYEQLSRTRAAHVAQERAESTEFSLAPDVLKALSEPGESPKAANDIPGCDALVKPVDIIRTRIAPKRQGNHYSPEWD